MICHHHVITSLLKIMHNICFHISVLILFVLHHTFVEGHYEVRSNIIQQSSKAVVSPFKSKTQRIPPLVDNHVPGPGAYSPHQPPAPVSKTILP